ncbi:SGNH/GDSL hydrolase family protein [Streptomyces sp. NRRL B-24484]|uniref:SGNH/GDSL hydrolase family protein n=1 Tax=Streptomyces sp. NRRL B-24484 TaxID=1463833 RepID=UPI0004C060C9|nr:SGNH/GDSL hydrolase family protein [Streptomyces sp. NRRL B-24484]
MRSPLPGGVRLAVAAALFTATALGLTAAPAAAAEHRPVPADVPRWYLALGDSLAAGYQTTPDGGRVVGRGYAQDIARVLGERAAARHRPFDFTDLGCPGETTGTMANGGCPWPHPWTDSQLAAAERFLREHRKDRVLVTIDIGANDVNRCASGGTIDLPCALQGIATAGRGLSDILGRLQAAAGPRTRIVGMNLYDPFLAAWLTGEQGRATAAMSLPLSHALNAAIGIADAAHGVPTADVARAFDTDELRPVPFNGTRVPLNVARIMQWTNMARGDIHANDAGYQVIADTFLARL